MTAAVRGATAVMTDAAMIGMSRMNRIVRTRDICIGTRVARIGMAARAGTADRQKQDCHENDDTDKKTKKRFDG